MNRKHCYSTCHNKYNLLCSMNQLCHTHFIHQTHTWCYEYNTQNKSVDMYSKNVANLVPWMCAALALFCSTAAVNSLQYSTFHYKDPYKFDVLCESNNLSNSATKKEVNNAGHYSSAPTVALSTGSCCILTRPHNPAKQIYSGTSTVKVYFHRIQ